jgi:toxin ParE1/3/4
VRLKWTSPALGDLQALRAYIEQDNPKAARATVQRIRAAIKPLIKHPGLGRPGRVEGTRELVIAGLPYIVAYRMKDQAVTVLRVLHAARRWPTDFQK